MRKMFSLIIILIINSCKKEQKEEYSNNNVEDTFLKKSTELINQSEEKLISNQIKTKQDSADYLVKCYDDFLSKKDSLSEVTFFNFFPDKFNTFNGLYGYTEEYNMPLSIYEEQHIIKYYENRKYVTNKEYYTKLFNICKTGKWDADAVNFIQHIVQTELDKNCQEAIDVLSKFTTKEKDGFWFFYFDGPIQDINLLKQLKGKLSNEDYNIASKAYTNVVNSYK